MNTSYRGITCQQFLSQWSVDNHISLGTVYTTQRKRERDRSFCRTGQKTIQQEEAWSLNVKALSTSTEPFCEGRLWTSHARRPENNTFRCNSQIIQSQFTGRGKKVTYEMPSTQMTWGFMSPLGKQQLIHSDDDDNNNAYGI
jgi:hypothetical protein